MIASICVCFAPVHRFRSFFFFNDTATTEIYTLSLHDALPIYAEARSRGATGPGAGTPRVSAALGDAPNLPGTFALAAAGAAACGVDYVKVGLRGLRGEDGSRDFLTAVVRAAGHAAPGGHVIAA